MLRFIAIDLYTHYSYCSHSCYSLISQDFAPAPPPSLSLLAAAGLAAASLLAGGLAQTLQESWQDALRRVSPRFRGRRWESRTPGPRRATSSFRGAGPILGTHAEGGKCIGSGGKG